MLIDFHTHMFPDAIAERSIIALKEGMRNAFGEEFVYPNHADGTVNGLIELMEKAGVDKSVILPIATREKQTETINATALELNNAYGKDGKLVSFGSVFPYQKDAVDVLKRLKENGFKGIKLHPEFQLCNADAPENVKILKAAEELELMVVFHSGIDVGFNTPPKCTPKMIHNILSEVSGEYIMLAHLGGFKMWEDVYEYIVGTKVYIDTAFSYMFIEDDMYKKILTEHDPNRILFGSDNPWEDPADTLKAIKKLGLSDELMEKIMYKNALRILS